MIWVVARARDEHRQAIEWLNQHTDSSFGFFLVEIELWSIGDSLPAPRFNVVEQPNEWTKTIKLSECLSETERTKLSYWTKYREVAQASFEFLKVFNPQKLEGSLDDAALRNIVLSYRVARRYAARLHRH